MTSNTVNGGAAHPPTNTVISVRLGGTVAAGPALPARIPGGRIQKPAGTGCAVAMPWTVTRAVGGGNGAAHAGGGDHAASYRSRPPGAQATQPPPASDGTATAAVPFELTVTSPRGPTTSRPKRRASRCSADSTVTVWRCFREPRDGRRCRERGL